MNEPPASSSIRVLRVIHDLQVGGVQRMLLRSALELHRRGIHTEICCLEQKGELARLFEDEGFYVHLIRFGSRFDPFGLLRLRRLVRERDIGVVHAHMYASNMAADLATLGMGSVAVINSYHSHRPTQSPGQERRLRWTQSLPEAFVAVSDSVRTALGEVGLPLGKVTVIHNGITIPESPEPLPKRGAGDPLHLVWAGRFVKQKRHRMMLEILRRCVQKNVPVRVTLVGDGPTRFKNERLAGEWGLGETVRFVGHANDVPTYLKAADFFISTSEREGFSNAMLESCAVGRAFIASDIPPHRELLGASSCGLVLSDEVEVWPPALERLWKDPAARITMGAAAYNRAQDFSLDAHARKLKALYEKLRPREATKNERGKEKENKPEMNPDAHGSESEREGVEKGMEEN